MPDQRPNPRLGAALDLAEPLARRFAEAGRHFYLVGGVVRDSLLGIDRAGVDLDATTEARPPEIKQIVADLADAVWTQGERFGTIGCRIDGHVYEITTHRAEIYDSTSRKPVVSFGDHLDDDLSRRDFTVNSIAVDVLDRTMIDPFDGESDLRNRVLRTPLDPSISFSDDPLRMLRAARFHASYELTPVPELTAAVARMIDRIEIVSVERIRIEFEKLLMLANPGPGFEMLRTTGLMAKVLPELAALEPEQLSLAVARVDSVEPLAVQRWAALLDDPSVVGQRLRQLKSAGAVVADTELLLSVARRVESASAHDDAEVRRLVSMGNGRVDLEMVIDWLRSTTRASGRSVDHLETLRNSLSRLRQVESDLDNPDIGIDGNRICELLAIEPGVDVGRAVTWLRESRVTRGVVPVAQLESELLVWWRSDGSDPNRV